MKSVVWVGVVLLLIGGLWAGVQPVAVTNADESYPYPSPWDTPIPEDVLPTEMPAITATPEATATDLLGDDATQTPESMPTNDEEPLAEPTPTATALPTEANGQQVFVCASGSTVEIRGNTTADTLLVLYFSGRAVSAALSGHDGTYVFNLNMGRESAGEHPLQVVQRNTGKLLATHYCNIP